MRQCSIKTDRCHMTHSLKKTSFLTEIRNSRAVVIREHAVTKDRVGYLRMSDHIHLNESSLKVTLFRCIRLEHVKQEGSGLWDHILRSEHVDDLRLHFGQRVTVCLVSIYSPFHLRRRRKSRRGGFGRTFSRSINGPDALLNNCPANSAP